MVKVGQQTQEDENPVVEESQAEEVIYSCHPLDRFTVGKWKFERGQLRLAPDEAQELDEWLKGKKVDPHTKRTIKKIDVSAAEAFLTKHLAQATKGAVQSTDALNQAGQQVGTAPVIPQEEKSNE